VKVNATSSHLQGDYNMVMNGLVKELKTGFQELDKFIFVLKVLKGELASNFSK